MDYSDLYNSAERNRCCVMDLLPLLIDVDTETGHVHVTPSCFMNEMQLSTEQRLEKLNQPLRKVMQQRLRGLKVHPDVVIFQNFKPGTKYTVPLRLINIEKVPIPIRLKMEPSAYFSISYPSDVVPSKIAPGMALTLEVSFAADNCKDYSHELTFFTEMETCDIMLIAIGPRPLLDLPDRITIPTTAINVQTEKTLLVRNLGQVTAKFVIETSPPFSVDTQRNTLKPDGLMRLTVYFTPTLTGHIHKHLKLRYETGEVLSVTLDAVAEEAPVTVSIQEIEFKETFLGLTTRVEVVINNASNYKLDYKWKRYEDVNDEVRIRGELKEKYADLKDYELRRSNRMDYYDIVGGEGNCDIYERILKDEQEELDKEDCFGFSDDNFVIYPLEGELWPRSRVNASFVFTPKSVGVFKKNAFLQTTGLLGRIPVALSAQCLGPSVHLNVEEIDVRNIYIRAVHRYEIMFINSGPIPAHIRYEAKPTAFGGALECSDVEFLLQPSSNKSVLIKFVSEVRGKFTECISFNILESGEVLHFNMTGRVICPLLQINCTEINFQTIPIGCQKNCEVVLRNPCQVPIEFNVYVKHDGNEKAYTLEEVAKFADDLVSLNFNPKEFTCSPSFGEVEPYGQTTLKINLIPNLLGSYVRELVIGMWSSSQYSKSIPVRYTSVCPEIVCSISKIKMRSMFIKQPYCRILTLENRSKIPGFVRVFGETADPRLNLDLNKNSHYIEPQERVELRLIISSDVIGSFTGCLNMYQFGESQPKTICTVWSNTRGPSVDINCEKILIGEIPTLTLIQRVIPISNDSPIRAYLTFVCSGEFLSTLEQDLCLEAEETGSFTLQVYGTVSGPFENTLNIHVEDGDVDTYPVIGNCVGGSILCEPRLEPMLDMGTILTEQGFTQKIDLVNKGKSRTSVYFSQHAVLHNFKNIVEPTSIVSIEPKLLDLMPNEIKTVSIKSMSRVTLDMNAIFYMHTKRDRKVSVNQFYLHANFEEPTIAFNKNTFEFYKDIGEDVEHMFLEDKLILLNCTNTELTVRLDIDKHFYLVDPDAVVKNLLTSTTAVLKDKKVFHIIFEPPVRNKKCYLVCGFLTLHHKDHPKVDKIALDGSVNFPDIEFQPAFVDFECLPENSSAYMLIQMRNVSPLRASYEFKWLSENYVLEDLAADEKAVSYAHDIKDKPSKTETFDESTLQTSTNELPSKQTSSDDDMYKERELWLYMQHLLTPIVDKYIQKNTTNHDFYRKIPEKKELCPIHKIIDVVPTKGHLDPFECQYVSIHVRPPYKQLIEARLTCLVHGGETETVSLRVESGDVSYNMSERTIDLGVVHFNAIASKRHVLENTGCVPFYYAIHLENVWFEFKPVPRWLNVSPQNGRLKAMEKVFITIEYFPGIVGYFHERIKLDVGYDDTLELDIMGCAVFPQVYFNLPRPSFESKQMNLLSYHAIRELVYPNHRNATYPICQAPEPELDDWATLTPQDAIPSNVDVSMGLERCLVRKFLLENPHVISGCFYNPSAFIANTGVPYYSLDLGYVSVDSTQQVELVAAPYKPFGAKLLWSKLPSRMVEKGFSLIHAKGHSSRFLLFTPKSKSYKAVEEELQFSLNVIVYGGLKIEIKVRVVVTKPQLDVGDRTVQFGHVECGHCLKKTIVFHNQGKIPCEWTASLENPGKKTSQHYYLRLNAGCLDVDEKCFFDLYFEPRRNGKIVWQLVITMAYSEDVVVSLKGFGMLPKLDVVERSNVFSPAIPYSLHNKITTTLTNFSPFPVELFFVDFDKQSEFEDEVIWTLCQYYNVPRIFTKPRKVGDSLPEDMVDLYYTIVDKLRQHLIEIIQNEYRRQEKSVNSGEDSTESINAKLTVSNEIEEIPDPLQNKSAYQLRALFKANMKNLRESGGRVVDDFESKVVVFDEEHVVQDDPSEVKEGVLLIFHGAPGTNYIQAANRTGRILNLPVYSIDRLIIKALISNESLAAIKVNEEIQTAYARIAANHDMLSSADSDPHDDLERKVGAILKEKPKDTQKKVKDLSKSSQDTKSSEKGSSRGSGRMEKDTFIGISKDFFAEILKWELGRFSGGLVIESLSSIFIHQPHEILLDVLNTVGNLRFIQFVYYACTFEEYAGRKRASSTEAERIINIKRVEEIIEMDQEEFDRLSGQEVELFRRYVVEPRKLESLKRQNKLRIKRGGQPIRESKLKGPEKNVKVKVSRETAAPDKGKRRDSTARSSSGRSSKSSKESVRTSIGEHEQALLTSDVHFSFIQHILEHWDRKNVHLLKPLPDKPAKSGGKISARSLKSRGSVSKKGSRAGSKKEHKRDSNSSSVSNRAKEPEKIPVKILTSDEVLAREYTGIPLMLFAGRQPDKNFVANYLAELDDFTRSLELLKNYRLPRFAEAETMYTVLEADPTELVKNVSDVFVPYDSINTSEIETISSPKNSSVQNSSKETLISDKVSVKSLKTSKDKSRTSEINSAKRKKDESLDSSRVLRSFTSRIILQPEEKFSYEFHFVPKQCGEYAHSYRLKTVACGHYFTIHLEAKADTPRIYADVKMMFRNVFGSRHKHEFSSGYLMDEALFNFGPVLTQNKETTISCLHAEEQINIISNSYVPTIITTAFLEPTDAFTVDNVPDVGLLVLPNNSQFLQLRAHPTAHGPTNAQLVITAKNNPAVHIVNLACWGSLYDVEFLPKDLVFERVLVDVDMKKALVLRNNGLLGVNWTFADHDDAFAVFQPDLKRGYLKPQSKQVVQFGYRAKELVDVPKKQLRVDIYDKDMKMEDPIMSEIVQISAEVIDILLEYVSEVDLQDLKVEAETTHDYKLTNKSKYDLRYSVQPMVETNDNRQDAEIRRYFSVEGANEGILKLHQPHEIKLKFHPKKPVQFTALPVFRFRFYDVVDHREVHSFDLQISARVYGSSFQLCPPSEVNFGHQLIETEVSKEIILKNNGKYAFTYAVLSARFLDKLKSNKMKKTSNGKKADQKAKVKKGAEKKKSKESSKSKSSKSKSSKSRASVKGSKHKIQKPTTLKEGIFTVASSTGKIEPKSVEIIKITCKPTKVGDYEESIVFYISESFGKTKNGQTLTLRAKGCIPRVDTSNFEEMFKEIKVVEKLDDALIHNPIFVIESKELCFDKTCLNIPNKVRMTLMNTGLIGAEMSCEITEGGSVFSIEPTSLRIESYNTEHVTVAFKPMAIEKFHGILEIGVFMDANKCQINLTGEGCLPEISMIESEINPAESSHSISFNPLMIGSTACKNVSFKNTGVLPCKVLLGIQDDESGVFSLIPEEYPMPLQVICEQEYLMEEFNHTIIAELKPGQTYTVQVKFTPNSEQLIRSVVKLYIINNPFETTEIFISGEGFKEDVVIEGLETINMPKSLNESDTLDGQHSRQLYYELDFGYRFINKLHKICFKIRNISNEDTYKFSFANLDKLTFLPAVGHLKPLACKEIIVAIYSKNPILYDRNLIQCKLCKIKYVSPQYESLSWDERQHFTIWKPANADSSTEIADGVVDESAGSTVKVKTIQERTEPPIEEIPGTVKTIKIYLSAILDYCSYSCSDSEINIDATPLFEKKSSTFVVSNTSSFPIDVKWDLLMTENYPKSIGACPSEDTLEDVSTPSRARPKTCFGMRKPIYLSGKETFLELNTHRPKSSCSSLSTGFSGSSDGNLQDSWTDFHLNPFTITPVDSTIPPGDSLTYTITFSPYQVFEYAVRAEAHMLNLKPGLEQLKIAIHAKSILPLYHFNIKPSNYLRLRGDTCGYPVDESTKVIEFTSIGIGAPVISKFTVINPTGEDFSFRWERGTRGDLSLFQCLTPKGSVSRGRMAEASFAFVPAQIGVFETLYVFFIEKYNLRTDFLLVGRAREPSVFFEKQSLSLKPTVIGIEISGEIIMRNEEAISLRYCFKKQSLYSEGRLQKVVAVPCKGVISGRSEERIRINFNPRQTGPVTFNVECKVEKLEKTLGLLLEGNCYEVQPKLTYITDFNVMELDYSKVNIIDLSTLIALRDVNLKISISNVGKIGFYYKWELLEKFVDEFVKIAFSHDEGYTKIDTTVENVVQLKPVKHLIRKNVSICVKIAYGPTYNINFVCSTCRTKFKFSFKEYDFGPCLVQNGRSYIYETTLEITNNDPSPLSICTENETFDHLTVINKANAIKPKKSGCLIIYFHPLQVQRYRSEITILVNGKGQKVLISGEGVPLEVELVNPADKLLNLGPVSMGRSKRRTVKVVNKSKCSITVGFELAERLKSHQQRTVLGADFERPEIKVSDVVLTKMKIKDDNKGSKKGKKDTSSSDRKGSKKSKKGRSSQSSKGSKKSPRSSKSSKSPRVAETPIETAEEREKRLIYKFLRVNPTKFIKLLPEQVTEVTLSYSPTERMPLFTEQIHYQVQQQMHPICMIKGCCVAPDYYLDQERVSFGTVIKGCSSEILIKLFNIGDFGGKFKWSFGKKSDSFSITPMEGYITTNMAVVFIVKFSPSYTRCLFRTMAQCVIDNFRPLKVELVGTCINLPAPEQILKFHCAVRELEQQAVSIKNPTGYDWTIKPSLSGQYFSVDSCITVKSDDSSTILVTYQPLSMTLSNRKHESNLFFPLPEGQGLLFHLIGEASRPKTIAIIERTITEKSYHTELLQVENWLQLPQQFAVLNQIDQPDGPAKVLYKLSGNSVIDVPPLESRVYKWIIYPLNDGKLHFKVKFRNETTGEYLAYEIILTITKCESLEVIRLTTCARQKVQHKILLQNPIKQPTTFTIMTSSADLHFKSDVYVNPYTTEELIVEYAPLLAANEHTVLLEAKTSTLGTFPYTFVLTAHPAEPEPTVYFQAQLGMSDTKNVYLYNSQDKQADFIYKINDPQFSIEQPLSIPPKENGVIRLTFEPDNLGGFRSNIVLTSPTLGEFMYPLIGSCVEPKPIGPYTIKEGVPTAIPFKNPFNTPQTFNISIEPASIFCVRNATEFARGKAAFKIYSGLAVQTYDKEYPATGKLYVSCEDEELAGVKWIIYVKAEARK